MTLDQWLDAQRGRANDLAQAMGASKAAVSNWRRDGVPLGLIRAVSEFSNDDVTVKELTDFALDRAEAMRGGATAQQQGA